MAGEWTVYPQAWQVRDAELVSLVRWQENLVAPRNDNERAVAYLIDERIFALKAAA